MFRYHGLALSLVLVFTYRCCFATVGSSLNGADDAQSQAKIYEESCVLTLRLLNTAQGTYEGGDTRKGYARSLKDLGLKGEGIIDDSRLDWGSKDGYRFVLTPGRADANGAVHHYSISARPLKVIVKGQRSFFTDESCLIRSTRENRAARASDLPIQ